MVHTAYPQPKYITDNQQQTKIDKGPQISQVILKYLI